MSEDKEKEVSLKEYKKKGKGRIAAKITAFIIIFCILLSFACNIFRQWPNGSDSGIVGFYELPEDSLQTIVLGASVAGFAVDTPQLYEDYGICAYNLFASWQSMLASYYWLEEAYSLHSETLTTVVLDVSTLRHTEEQTKYHKASIDLMRFSRTKIKATLAYSEDLHDAINNLIPLFFYHTRWSGNLVKSDLTGAKNETADVLGYEFTAVRYIDSYTYDEMSIINGVLDAAAEPTEFGEDAQEYFYKIIEFCDENDIELVLIKTTFSGWSSSDHNAVQEIADECGLTFLDFNFDPLFSEIDLNLSTDTKDSFHANYYGAAKITAYLGQWLTENSDVIDVRGDEDYTFMEEYLEEYHSEVTDVIELKETTYLIDYLETAMADEDNEIFLLVKDSLPQEISEEVAQAFSGLGLTALSSLGYRSSYIGIIDEGTVVYEEADSFDEALYTSLLEEAELLDDEEAEELMAQFSSLTYEVEINGVLFSLESGGYYTGDIASCVIDGGSESAVGTRGLNIIVYSKSQQKVTDSTVFDLLTSYEKESLNIEEASEAALAAGTEYEELTDTLKEYIKYNRRTEISALTATIDLETGDDGLLTYLKAYMEEEDLAIFLSVKDEAADSLSDEAREYLAELGLIELSEIEHRDSYIGVILDGEVVYEVTDHGETEIEYSDILYSIESGGYDSGNTSSIEINGTEYSTASRGINVVVYDTELGILVDKSNFDTYAIEQTVPDGEGE